MSRRARFRSLIATVVGLATVGLAGAGFALVPATAANAAAGTASISLNGVPASFATGQQVNLSSTVDLGGTGIANPFRSLSATFYINSTNLTGSQVQFSWKRAAEGDWHNNGLSRKNGLLSTSFNPFSGRVVAGQANLQIRLTFRSNAQPQAIQIGITLKGSQQHQSVQQLAQAGPFTSAIGGVAPPPTTPSPTEVPSTAPATSGATAAASGGALAAGPVITTGGAEPSTGASSVGWILYVVGGLLLIAGVGVVGTMLWQRMRPQTESDGSDGGDGGYPVSDADYPADPYPQATYLRQQRPSAPVQPTQAYPQQQYQQEQYAQEAYLQDPYAEPYPQQDPYSQQPYSEPYPQQPPRGGRHSADQTRPMPPL